MGQINDIHVQMYNKVKDYSISAVSNDNNEVIFDELESGIYQISTSHEVEGDGVRIILNGATELIVTDSLTHELDLISTFVQTEGAGL